MLLPVYLNLQHTSTSQHLESIHSAPCFLPTSASPKQAPHPLRDHLPSPEVVRGLEYVGLFEVLLIPFLIIHSLAVAHQRQHSRSSLIYAFTCFFYLSKPPHPFHDKLPSPEVVCGFEHIGLFEVLLVLLVIHSLALAHELSGSHGNRAARGRQGLSLNGSQGLSLNRSQGKV